MVPLPTVILSHFITFLRYGSSEVVNFFLGCTGITYIRDGLTYHLSNITIYIAKECSGIRSSTALIITSLIAGQMFLKTIPGKTALIISVIPLTLIKNGIRITTLTVLAQKVDTAWITHSKLHHGGGIVFFAIVLILLFSILFLIKKIEKWLSPNKE